MKRRAFLGLLAKLPIIVAAAAIVEPPAPTSIFPAPSRAGLPLERWGRVRLVTPTSRPVARWVPDDVPMPIERSPVDIVEFDAIQRSYDGGRTWSFDLELHKPGDEPREWLWKPAFRPLRLEGV